MQIPDDSVVYEYAGALARPTDAWTPNAELKSRHFLDPQKLQDLVPELAKVRSHIAAERELRQVPEEMQPLDSGFIDLPQKTLDDHRRRGEKSVLGRTLAQAAKLRIQVGHVVLLGIGGSYLGARALFDALCHSYHNQLPAKDRHGTPCLHFEGNNVDNDSFQELLEFLQLSCVDPDLVEERWGVVVVSKSGGTLETAAAFRTFRKEMADYYGPNSPALKELVIPVTGDKGKLRDYCVTTGYSDDDILTIPNDVGGRYSVFTPVGLLPAAIMGLDVRGMLLGALTMTQRFLDEPFDRNPVLQYAAVNHLLTSQMHKPIRVMSIWSKKLESLGLWYDQLLAESLGKRSEGPTPITAVNTRDLHSRGQQHQEGMRDKMINNLIVKNINHPPIKIEMEQRDEDGLNELNRVTYPDVLEAAIDGTNEAYADTARPTADLILPNVTAHSIGQLLQMLMLATVVEGRLMGVNPYGQPGVEGYKRNMMKRLRVKAQELSQG